MFTWFGRKYWKENKLKFHLGLLWDFGLFVANWICKKLKLSNYKYKKTPGKKKKKTHCFYLNKKVILLDWSGFRIGFSTKIEKSFLFCVSLLKHSVKLYIQVSPWHDIPLHLGDGVFNFVVEIPKESSAKMEVATDEQHTPIKQDTKKGKLRYYP